MRNDRVPVLVGPLMTIILAILAAAGAALFVSTRSAHAEIEGTCDATVAGVAVGPLDSGDRGDDIHVSQHDTVVVGATSPAGFQSHKIQLEFASHRWTVSDKQDDGSTAWSGTVNVDDYATYGVGLYKVIGVSTLSDGTTCEGAATVDVDGNPLTTVAGGVAVGTVILGTAGGLATGVVAAAGSPGRLRDTASWVEDAVRQDTARQEELASEREETSQSEAERNIGDFLWNPFLGCLGCFCFAALAVMMTPLMMVAGGAGGAPQGGEQPPSSATGQPRRLPRAPWGPRITLLGLLGGLIAGAGLVVLLQQYSIAYPTLGVIITTVVIAMVVYGVVLPTLGYTIGWLRLNGRIARLEESIGWR